MGRTSQRSVAIEAKEGVATLQAWMELSEERAAAAGAVPQFMGSRRSVGKAFVEALRKILLAEATPAATRQEFLDGFVACLVEAKERAAVLQAFVELDVLGAVAAGAVPELLELGLTSPRMYGAEAAVKTLGKIHCAEWRLREAATHCSNCWRM